MGGVCGKNLLWGVGGLPLPPSLYRRSRTLNLYRSLHYTSATEIVARPAAPYISHELESAGGLELKDWLERCRWWLEVVEPRCRHLRWILS